VVLVRIQEDRHKKGPNIDHYPDHVGRTPEA
jgi:hypothetical protein